jgi:transcriptional regulator with XRE-family HTH domain
MNKEEIKEIRIQRKLTQEQMAFQLKCTRQTVFNLENGRTRPTKAMLRRLERQKRKLDKSDG